MARDRYIYSCNLASSRFAVDPLWVAHNYRVLFDPCFEVLAAGTEEGAVSFELGVPSGEGCIPLASILNLGLAHRHMCDATLESEQLVLPVRALLDPAFHMPSLVEDAAGYPKAREPAGVLLQVDIDCAAQLEDAPDLGYVGAALERAGLASFEGVYMHKGGQGASFYRSALGSDVRTFNFLLQVVDDRMIAIPSVLLYVAREAAAVAEGKNVVLRWK